MDVLGNNKNSLCMTTRTNFARSSQNAKLHKQANKVNPDYAQTTRGVSKWQNSSKKLPNTFRCKRQKMPAFPVTSRRRQRYTPTANPSLGCAGFFPRQMVPNSLASGIYADQAEYRTSLVNTYGRSFIPVARRPAAQKHYPALRQPSSHVLGQQTVNFDSGAHAAHQIHSLNLS